MEVLERNGLLLPDPYLTRELFVLWFNTNESNALLFMAFHAAAAQSPGWFLISLKTGREEGGWFLEGVCCPKNGKYDFCFGN